MMCVYKIQSLVKPERVYIGSSCDFTYRVYDHKKLLRANRHHSKQLQRHVNKYGINDISFHVVVEVFNDSDLLPTEQKYIDDLRPYFNSSKVAGSRKGVPHSDETKAKISATSKERMANPENRKKLSDMNKGKKFGLGYKFTDEQRAKCSIWKIGRPRTEETRRKISISMMGNKRAKKAA